MVSHYPASTRDQRIRQAQESRDLAIRQAEQSLAAIDRQIATIRARAQKDVQGVDDRTDRLIKYFKSILGDPIPPAYQPRLDQFIALGHTRRNRIKENAEKRVEQMEAQRTHWNKYIDDTNTACNAAVQAANAKHEAWLKSQRLKAQLDTQPTQSQSEERRQYINRLRSYITTYDSFVTSITYDQGDLQVAEQTLERAEENPSDTATINWAQAEVEKKQAVLDQRQAAFDAFTAEHPDIDIKDAHKEVALYDSSN